MSKLFDKTMVKVLLVGVVNTLVGVGTMFLLYNLAHCSYWISSAANYVVGGIVSFFLNKYFTFQNKDWSWGQVGKFIVSVPVCYLLGLRPCKASGAAPAGGTVPVHPGECGHAGRHVPVHGSELPGPAVLCI